jgi:hypothetical protein
MLGVHVYGFWTRFPVLSSHGWAELLRLATADVLNPDCPQPYLYYNGSDRVLAVQVATEDAETLAAALTDRMLEFLGT